MSPRRRFVIYLVLVHLLFAGLAIWLLRGRPAWLLAAEVVLVASCLVGVKLARDLFAGLTLAADTGQLLEDGDFTSRLREVGQGEVDRLIRVYNRMADHLRDERVRAQEQHAFLGRVLQESPGGILVLDLEGRVSLVNPAAARLLSASSSALVGHRLHELPGPLGRELAGLAQGASRTVGLPGARRVRCQHGSFVDRGFRRSFLMLEELTDELRRSERAAYEKLIRVLSHEVNNTVGASNSLLHSCRAYASQLRQDDRRDFEQALGVVIGRTEQLNAFMRSFADVVRLPPPQRQPWRVAELVRTVGLLVQAECARRRIEWRTELDETLPAVALDRAQVEQVLLNVVKNAVEAIGERGTLTVRSRRANGRCVLEVEDSGPGIPEDVRPHLFTPFFSTKDRGQGIGLTLVQEILVNHGFDFALDGPPGGPTRFTIAF